MNAADNASLRVLRTCPGRALYAQADGTFYMGQAYGVFSTNDDGASWSPVFRMPRPITGRLTEVSRIACRLFRHEVRALVELPTGGWVAAARGGVFWADRDNTTARPSLVDGGKEQARTPMSLTLGPNGRVLWGEYWANRRCRQVRVYVSDDDGRSFEVAYTFKPGEIRHIHNLLYDDRNNVYWVLAGDHGDEPGIGRLSADCKSFDWLVKGKQVHRAVCPFDMGDHLVYGTDTEMEPNAAIRLDKATGQIERLVELDGSCIYACRFGRLHAMTTSVEPSPVNTSRHASLWVSYDAERWTRVYRAKKDLWNATCFQFGSIVLPRGSSDRETMLLSGQALEGIDGQVLVAQAVGVPPQSP